MIIKKNFFFVYIIYIGIIVNNLNQIVYYFLIENINGVVNDLTKMINVINSSLQKVYNVSVNKLFSD